MGKLGKWLLNVLGGIALMLLVVPALFCKPSMLRGDPRQLMTVREL